MFIRDKYVTVLVLLQMVVSLEGVMIHAFLMRCLSLIGGLLNSSQKQIVLSMMNFVIPWIFLFQVIYCVIIICVIMHVDFPYHL